MTGTCQFATTENEERTELIEILITGEFDSALAE